MEVCQAFRWLVLWNSNNGTLVYDTNRLHPYYLLLLELCTIYFCRNNFYLCFWNLHVVLLWVQPSPSPFPRRAFLAPRPSLRHRCPLRLKRYPPRLPSRPLPHHFPRHSLGPNPLHIHVDPRLIPHPWPLWRCPLSRPDVRLHVLRTMALFYSLRINFQ